MVPSPIIFNSWHLLFSLVICEFQHKLQNSITFWIWLCVLYISMSKRSGVENTGYPWNTHFLGTFPSCFCSHFAFVLKYNYANIKTTTTRTKMCDLLPAHNPACNAILSLGPSQQPLGLFFNDHFISVLKCVILCKCAISVMYLHESTSVLIETYQPSQKPNLSAWAWYSWYSNIPPPFPPFAMRMRIVELQWGI